MRNRLLHYELILFRRSFVDAFAGFADRALLGIVVTLALLTAPRWLSGPPFPPWLLPSAALLLFFEWHRAVRARLALLSSESVVAADALDAQSRSRYVLCAHALLLAPLLCIAWARAETTVVATVGLTLAAAAAGISATAIARLPVRRRAGPGNARSSVGEAKGARAAFRALLSRQMFGRPKPEAFALVALLAVFFLTGAAALLAPRSPAGAAIAGAPALLFLLLFTTRLDAELLGFLPFAGFGPASIALAVTALPVAGFAAASAALLLLRPADGSSPLFLLAVIHLAVIATSVVRGWLYPGRSARSVHLQVQTEVAAFLAIAAMLGPLAVAALAWRLAIHYRRHHSLRWAVS